MKCCILVQHFITKSRSLLVDQSELLYSSVEQLLIIIIAVLSKQTKDWQERKRCTSGVDEKWRYRLQARTMAAWLTGHIKRCNWDKTQYPNLFVFFLLLLPLFFFFFLSLYMLLIWNLLKVNEQRGLIIGLDGGFCLFFLFLPNLIF